jgi:hypothetical protein
VRRGLLYLIVVVLAVELALWEAFLTAARPLGVALPVSALLAGVGNLVVGLGGARVLGKPVGAVIPGVLWLGIALALGSGTAAGDRVVLGNWRGGAFLLVGTASAAAAVGLAGNARKPGATPQ